MIWLARIVVVIALVAFIVGAFGCGVPSSNFAAYGSAMNGQFGYPSYYAAPPAYYYPVAPTRTTCMSLPGGGGGWVSCRSI